MEASWPKRQKAKLKGNHRAMHGKAKGKGKCRVPPVHTMWPQASSPGTIIDQYAYAEWLKISVAGS